MQQNGEVVTPLGHALQVGGLSKHVGVGELQAILEVAMPLKLPLLLGEEHDALADHANDPSVGEGWITMEVDFHKVLMRQGDVRQVGFLCS